MRSFTVFQHQKDNYCQSKYNHNINCSVINRKVENLNDKKKNDVFQDRSDIIKR